MMKNLVILDERRNISNLPLGDETLVLALNQDIQKRLKERNINFKKTEDYLSKEDYKNIGGEALMLVRKWGKIKINNETLRKFLTYKDLPFWDLIEANFAARIFEGSEKMQNIKLMKKVMQTEKPDKIFAKDLLLLGRTAVCVAKALGIELEKTKP